MKYKLINKSISRRILGMDLNIHETKHQIDDISNSSLTLKIYQNTDNTIGRLSLLKIITISPIFIKA